jgi:peptidoglycan hydrolase-like protein with peptidoglycan-binding domain
VPIQTKLAVSEPGDAYEREADRIAEQVMATTAHVGVGCARPRIQRVSGQSNAKMDATPANVDQTLASSGSPLDPALRQDMEQRFRYDFSKVRVHSDAAAGQSARQVNARAYTVGSDIVFNHGQFNPATILGRKLLAHELVHTIQQSATGLEKGPGAGSAVDLDHRAKRLQRQVSPATAHLQSPRFSPSAKLERCFEDTDRLGQGDPDTDAVRRIQQALIDVQQITGNTYDLGSTGRNNDGVDGNYGPKTAAAVKKFKADEKLGFTQFGDVGPGTMHRLDQLFAAGGTSPPGPDAAAIQCPPDPTLFEVTREDLFANPRFDFDFSGGERPSLSTRAPSAPFFWNVAVKTRRPVQGCVEVGFLQTLRSAFQAAVYTSQASGQERLCLVIVPTPIRDAKPEEREPWYQSPARLGVNCFPGIVIPPGISAAIDATSVAMDDNPFSRWCIFLGSEAENAASDCGLSNAAFRLSTLVETLAFDAWLVLRPLDNVDVNCFTFLRHASWFKSVEIVVAPSGTLGFLKRDLGVTLLELGDGIGETSPEFGSQTPAEAAERACVTSAPPTPRKTVSLNITQVAGSKRSPSRSVASAVKIYDQAAIDIVAQINPPLSHTQSKAILGDDLVLEESFFGSPTTEERALFQINNTPDAVSIYFVKKMEDFTGHGDFGESFDAACGVGIVGGVVGDNGTDETLAHELGHVLMNVCVCCPGVTTHVLNDPTNLMAAGGPNNGSNATLTSDQIRRMRNSPFAK